MFTFDVPWFAEQLEIIYNLCATRDINLDQYKFHYRHLRDLALFEGVSWSEVTDHVFDVRG